MPDTSDFRNGLRIEIEGDPWVMTYFQHVKPGKGGAFVRTKIRNLRTGKSVDRTYRAGERVVEADIEDRTMTYLYAEAQGGEIGRVNRKPSPPYMFSHWLLAMPPGYSDAPTHELLSCRPPYTRYGRSLSTLT